MAKTAAHQIVSANELGEGQVIYLRADGSWSEALAEAAVAHGKQAGDELLALAERSPHIAVGPYLVGIELDGDGCPTPSHMREVMRQTGPTVARQYLAA